MQINDVLCKSIAFLGQSVSDQFHISGTAFLASITVEDYDFRYFITARHVVWEGRIMGFDVSPPDREISIRLNSRSGPPQLIRTNARDWIFHDKVKNVDICAYRFSIDDHNPNGDLDIGFLDLQTLILVKPSDDFAKYGIKAKRPGAPTEVTEPDVVAIRNIQLGDEVFLTGAFISHVGRKKNLPIVRVGSIAAMPEEPIDFFSPTKPAYLIETRSTGGISGSPVFLHLYPERRRGDWKAMGRASITSLLTNPTDIEYSLPYVLVGMLLGNHMSSAYLNDFLPVVTDNNHPSDADINSGISVVLPVSEILDFLYLPKIVREREIAIAERG